MSDDPSNYWLGIEKPVLPVILAAVLVPAAISGFAIWLWGVVVVTRALGVGALIGLAVIITVSEMFAKGCPLVDFFIEHDTPHYF